MPIERIAGARRLLLVRAAVFPCARIVEDPDWRVGGPGLIFAADIRHPIFGSPAPAPRSLTLGVRADSGGTVLGIVAVAPWGAGGAGAGTVAARYAVFRGALLVGDAEGVE